MSADVFDTAVLVAERAFNDLDCRVFIDQAEILVESTGMSFRRTLRNIQ